MYSGSENFYPVIIIYRSEVAEAKGHDDVVKGGDDVVKGGNDVVKVVER